jgi:predicted DNA-binding WGR domain protein
MHPSRVGLVAVAFVWLSAHAASPTPPEGFASLFNGKNLDGWTVRQADKHDWSVVDGVIDCNPHGPGKGDQNLWTKKEYGDFELLVDWRIKESPYVNRNARIILPDGSYKKDAAGKEIAIAVPNTDSGTLAGTQHTVRFGRIGTDGQTVTKTFENAVVARQDCERLIRSKQAKGYQEK